MLTIANLRFESPYILAPLAGYTDLPFRLLCREHGAGYCVSEMISCHGLCYKQEKTLSMLKSVDGERPVAMQIFGADEELMGEAARIVSDHSPDLIDINMGCPVKKVTKRGAGAALMADPCKAERIIRAVVRNSEVPVTVKFRAGPDSKTINCVEFAKMAQDCGAAALTIHGRTWSQGFTGRADQQYVAQVKEAVTIPVIGNGDIQDVLEADEMMRRTGCDGVMIGRAALGNPWAFSPGGRPGDVALITAAALRHAELMERYLPTDRMLGCIKNHLGRYFRGLPGSSAMRRAVYDCPSFAELKTLFQQYS